MSLEDEMRLEMRKIEKEISLIDTEMTKLHTKILQLLSIRKKKEHDLKVLRTSFGENEINEKDIQTNLFKLIKEQ